MMRVARRRLPNSRWLPLSEIAFISDRASL